MTVLPESAASAPVTSMLKARLYHGAGVYSGVQVQLDDVLVAPRGAVVHFGRSAGSRVVMTVRADGSGHAEVTARSAPGHSALGFVALDVRDEARLDRAHG